MLVPGPGGVNGTGLLGHITKAVGKDKLFFPDFSQSGNKTQGNRGLGSENASLLTRGLSLMLHAGTAQVPLEQVSDLFLIPFSGEGEEVHVTSG